MVASGIFEYFNFVTPFTKVNKKILDFHAFVKSVAKLNILRAFRWLRTLIFSMSSLVRPPPVFSWSVV